MAIRNVKFLKKQKGVSLIEFMVSSMIALIALGIVGSVYISGQKAAKEHSHRLLLMQNLQTSVQLIKEDIQRAGHYPIPSSSGMASVLQFTSSADEAVLTYSFYDQSGNLIQEKYKHKPSNFEFERCPSICFDIFDTNQIQVTRFLVEGVSLAGSGATSSMSKVTLEARLKNDHSVSHAASIYVKNRNWQ